MVFPKHNKHHLIVSTNYIASQAVFVFLIFACFLYVCINQEIIRDMDFSFLWIFSEIKKNKRKNHVQHFWIYHGRHWNAVSQCDYMYKISPLINKRLFKYHSQTNFTRLKITCSLYQHRPLSGFTNLPKSIASAIVSGSCRLRVSGNSKVSTPAATLATPNTTSGRAWPKSPGITLF